jgi:protein Cut8
MSSGLYYPRRLSKMFNSMAAENGSSSMAGRKRGAEEMDSQDIQMSSTSPSPLPHYSTIKRSRIDNPGRPLSLSRLLQTMDADALRDMLKKACDNNPSLATEVQKSAPKPTPLTALSVIRDYEKQLEDSFPYGDSKTSPYAYDRVRQPLMALLEALGDFTSSFLQPNETQFGASLQFLDGATSTIHRIPNFENVQHSIPKQNAYEQISKAWCAALREAEKRGGGIQLIHNGWDKKLMRHYEQGGDGLSSAIQELQKITSWNNSESRVSSLLGDVGVVSRGGYRVAEVSG